MESTNQVTGYHLKSIWSEAMRMKSSKVRDGIVYLLGSGMINGLDSIQNKEITSDRAWSITEASIHADLLDGFSEATVKKITEWFKTRSITW